MPERGMDEGANTSANATYVNADGTHQLTAVLAAAVTGAEIILGAGTFFELQTVEIPAGVTVRGSGTALSIIESSATPALALSGDAICITGLSVRCKAVAARPHSRPTSRLGVPSRPGTATAMVALASADARTTMQICDGARVQVSHCCFSGGGVYVGDGSRALLHDNEIDGGGIEMHGTDSGCELCRNTIRDSAGNGVLLSARAAGLVADNRISKCRGAGIEVAHGATARVLRNEVVDAQGIGLLLHAGGGGEVGENVVRGAGSRAAEVCGSGADVLLRDNKLLDSAGGVGVLLHGGTTARLEGGEITGHPLGGIEIGSGSAPTITSCTVRNCGQAGVLITAGGGGTLRSNRIEANLLHGIECCTTADLVVEANTVSGHKRGAGIFVHAGGRGVWIGNTLSANAVGAELAGQDTMPELRRNKILSNTRAGVQVRQGAHVVMHECQVRSNGGGCVVSGGRRGERTVGGDDAGAGIVVHGGCEVRLQGNTLSNNTGAGLFTHAGAHVDLDANVFRGNRGDAVRARPSSSTVLSAADARCRDHQRAVTPIIMPRQRVPFDWTVGDNVSADDKTLADRTAEMHAQYRSMSGDKAGSMAMLPEGVDPSSALCVLC